MTEQPMIAMRGVNKWFGAFHVLKDVDLEVRRGQRVVVCGPSGSGKSTLIRCINRLEEHDEGEIVVDGIRLDEKVEHIAATRREVGMVFQQFNLFPHLTAVENLMLAPRLVRKISKKEAQKEFMINYRVENLEELVKLLREEGVTICDEIASYEYGKFVHIMDVDGNKIELWEPNDDVFDQFYQNKK